MWRASCVPACHEPTVQPAAVGGGSMVVCACAGTGVPSWCRFPWCLQCLFTPPAIQVCETSTEFAHALQDTRTHAIAIRPPFIKLERPFPTSLSGHTRQPAGLVMKHVSMLLAILSGYFLPVAALMQGLACAPMPLPLCRPLSCAWRVGASPLPGKEWL